MEAIGRLEKEKRPEVYNLLTLMAAATDTSIEKVYDEYKVRMVGRCEDRISRCRCSSLLSPTR